MDFVPGAGRLRAVGYRPLADLPGRIGAVVLEFTHGTWEIGVDPGRDTVTFARPTGPPGPGLVDASARPPWSAAVGERLQWAWILSNQQGYEDALQLAFTGARATVQLLAAGSALRVQAVTGAG